MLHALNILGVKITSESKKNILEYLFKRLEDPQKKTFIITPNPEMLVYATHHLDYKDKLNTADIALPDGVGLFFASSFMGKQLKERITGVDFIEELCKESAELPLSMGFLGGRAGVAKRAAECLKSKYPWINVVFIAEEWSKEGYISKEKSGTKQNNTHNHADGVVQRKVQRSSAIVDILFVAYGVPKQEEWIYEHLTDIPVKAAIGVGGAFDYLSGNVRRAPFIVRFIGLEWLFRLIIQPWRWKRQLALIEFISLVFKQKFSS